MQPLAFLANAVAAQPTSTPFAIHYPVGYAVAYFGYLRGVSRCLIEGQWKVRLVDPKPSLILDLGEGSRTQKEGILFGLRT